MLYDAPKDLACRSQSRDWHRVALVFRRTHLTGLSLTHEPSSMRSQSSAPHSNLHLGSQVCFVNGLAQCVSPETCMEVTNYFCTRTLNILPGSYFLRAHVQPIQTTYILDPTSRTSSIYSNSNRMFISHSKLPSQGARFELL